MNQDDMLPLQINIEGFGVRRYTKEVLQINFVCNRLNLTRILKQASNKQDTIF